MHHKSYKKYRRRYFIMILFQIPIILIILSPVSIIKCNVYMSKCIENILEHISVKHITLWVYMEKDVLLSIPHIRISDSNQLKYMEPSLIDLYILEAENETVSNIYSIKKFGTYNFKTKIIVLVNNIDVTLVQHLLNNYLYNFILIQTKNCSQFIYTAFPYDEENLHKPIYDLYLINKCKYGKLLNNSTVFFNKIPTYWRNTTIDVLAQPKQPFVIINESLVSGLEVDYLNLIKESLKFVVNYNISTYESTGFFNNGYYTDCFGAIYRREVDTAIGYFLGYNFEYKDFEPTVQTFLGKVAWAVPKSNVQPAWRNIANIFSPESWVLIGILLMFMSLMFTILDKQSSNFIKLYLNNSLESLKIYLNMPSTLINSKKLKYLVISFSVLSLIVSTVISGNLVSMLSAVTYEKQIHSLEDIVKAKLKIYAFPNTIRYYDPNNHLEKYVLENSDSNNNHRDYLDKVAYENAATISDTQYILYSQATKYLKENGESLIHLGQSSQTSFLIWYFQKNCPIVENINNALMRIKDRGLQNYFIEKIRHKLNVRYHTAIAKNRQIKALSLNHIFIAFIIIIIGHGIGIIIFCLEMLCNLFLKL